MKVKWPRWFRSIGRFFSEAHYTLMGHRVREIRLDIGEVRNAVLALQLNAMIENCADGDGRPELAVVTCLPFDETGIARFSETHLARWEGAFDVFTEITDYRKLIRAIGQLTAKRAGSSVFAVDALPAKAMVRQYRRVLFVIGNSDHNIVLLKAMREYIAIFGAEQVYCFLHDPVCFNVSRRALGLSEVEYGRQLAELHGRAYKDIVGREKYIFDDFLAAGIHGPRLLTHHLGLRHFIVNSTAARDIVLADCADAAPSVDVLFHPVFDLEIAPPAPLPSAPLLPACDDGELIIGSYGSPSLDKRTDVIIHACERLVDEGRRVKLLLSGYGGKVYLKRHYGDHVPAWIELSHSDTEVDFQTQMARCHVAVQLRRRNLGESSGVVPTLLRLGKTVIASPIGAFTDYGDAVLYFDGDAAMLADMLRQGVRVSDARMAAYVAAHDVTAFNRALAGILSPTPRANPLVGG